MCAEIERHLKTFILKYMIMKNNFKMNVKVYAEHERLFWHYQLMDAWQMAEEINNGST